MSDGGIVTAEVGGWTVTSNTAGSESKLRENLKPKVDEGVSQAAKELGKRGGEAAAKAKAEKPAEEAQEPEAKPEKVEAKPIPDAKPEPVEETKPEPEAKAEGEEKPPEKDKRGDPRHDPRARMLQATQQAAEAKRALAAERQAREALEARLAALEAGRSAPKAESEPTPKREGKPVPADFESYEDYLDARDAFNLKQWESEMQKRAQMSAVDRALGEQIGKFHKAAGVHLEKYSEDVLSLRTEFQLAEGEQPDGSNWLANELVFNSEAAPSLMLHFTEHPEDLQRIAALSTPRAVSREMAKLEARLEAAPSGNSPKREDVSRAAPPVKPVTGKPYVSDGDEYRPGMSLDEYARVWRKQNARR